MIYADAYLRGCIISSLYKLYYASSSLFLITIPHNANYHLIIHGKSHNVPEYIFVYIFNFLIFLDIFFLPLSFIAQYIVI